MNKLYIINTVIRFINFLFSVYYIMIVARVFMTWIPNIDWEREPARTLRAVVDPYLLIFRRFIPAIGGIDFSPVIALILLPFIQTAIITLVSMLQNL